MRSAIDGRTTRFGGYRASQIARKRVEHPFGWIKSVAGLFQLKHRGPDSTTTLDSGASIGLTQTSRSGLADPWVIITFFDICTGIPKSTQRLRASSLQLLALTET